MMKKRIMALTLTGIMAASLLTGCGLNDSASAATIDGTTLTAGQLNFYARYLQSQYETYYKAYFGDEMWTTEVEDGVTYEQHIKESALEEMENMILLEAHMEDYDVSISDEEQSLIEETAASFVEANDEEDLKDISGSEEVVERVLTLMAIEQKMEPVIEAEADTDVTDEEAAQKSMNYVCFSYTTTDDEGNTVDLSDDEKAEALENAKALAEAAKNGEDFAALANEYGVDISTLTFDGDDESPSADLIQAADALKEGETTEAIETDTGVYVAKLTSEFDEAATEDMKTTIANERMSDHYTEVLDGYRDDAEISENKDILDKISFTQLTVTIFQDETEDETTTDSAE